MTIRTSVILAFGLCLTPAFAQTLPVRKTGNAEHPRRQQQGFGEYALGKINPGNADLGAFYQAARDRLVRGTIDDVYFWSNCVSLTLLVGVTGFCFLNLRASDKKERIAATLIAQMWNGRVSDKVEIERRTETYNALVDSHNELVENSLAPRRSQRKEQIAVTEQTAEIDAPAVETEEPAEGLAAPASARTASGRENVSAEMQTAISLNHPAPTEETATRPTSTTLDMEQQIRRLKSQVHALQNREANLLVRVNAQEELKRQYRDQLSGANTRSTRA